MSRNVIATLVFAALVSGGPVFAQPATDGKSPAGEKLSGEALGACMLANVSASDEAQMKAMMIDALKDDTEALNRSVMAMGINMLVLAQQHCGLKITDLQSPEFEHAASVYGRAMGERIMSKALSKIGQ